MAGKMVIPDEGKADPIVLHEGLVAAAAGGDIETVIDPIEKGADVSAGANFIGTKSTALVAAVNSEIDDEIKVEHLLAQGANTHVRALGYTNVLQMFLDCKASYRPN